MYLPYSVIKMVKGDFQDWEQLSGNHLQYLWQFSLCAEEFYRQVEMAGQYDAFPEKTEHLISENQCYDKESCLALILQPLGCTKSQDFQLEQG